MSAERSDAAPVRLVVLFGGQSAEREVSRITARHVLANVDPDRYEVVPVGITEAGTWVRADEAARLLAAEPAALPDALPLAGTDVEPLPVLRGAADPAVPTVVLPLLHGPLGEDGTVQGLLELADVAYVGTGVLGSALAMDKAKAKELAAANDLPQARWRTVHADDLVGNRVPTARRLVDELGDVVFVKPANMGSSIGVSKARGADEVAAALELAARYDEWLVVEEAVRGREIEVAVLGNRHPEASVPGEIVPGAEFYDYADKYVAGAAALRIPAPLDPDATATVRALALDAYRALRCEGMARVDFFYEAGGRGFLLNEVNTIPGFTPVSMYPQLWEATGLPYRQLIDRLVELALERHRRRAAYRRA